MVLNLLRGTALSSSVLIMPMKGCSNTLIVTYSSWNKRNTFKMALTGKELILKTIQTV
nr:hypothetical protein SOVF_105820 isoform A [Ipomoea batatas]GMD41608.1 hypothetical protein SOVF_105820 isoform A [Ipomoea batatas]GMD44558.1 hypothetical protein SOVF_105820 isoform A [Ipomoea batatas]GMD47778.1 hypothetical protein SOVF_105820 isoform A [Ipomoea batatas]